MKNNLKKALGALKQKTGIGTFEKEIRHGLTETRFGKGKFSVGLNRLTYTRQKDAPNVLIETTKGKAKELSQREQVRRALERNRINNKRSDGTGVGP